MHLITRIHINLLSNDTAIKETVYSGQRLFRDKKGKPHLLISRVNKMNDISLLQRYDLKNVHNLLFSYCILMMQLRYIKYVLKYDFCFWSDYKNDRIYL